jgi:hypothetical protein
MARKTESIKELTDKIIKLEKRKKAMEQERILTLGKITERHLHGGFKDMQAFIAEVQAVTL